MKKLVTLISIFLFSYQCSFSGTREIVPDKLPYLFLKNEGQWDNHIFYRGFVNGVSTSFMKDGVSFICSREKENIGARENSIPELEYREWDIHFLNRNINAQIEGYHQLNSKCNFYLGNDASKWVTNVSQYSELVYENIYNNIDLSYYGTGEKLKYDFILHAGAVMDEIQLEVNGIKKLSISEQGSLYIHHPWGIIEEAAPYTYQYIDGEKKIIDVKYVLINDSTFGFKTNEKYDRSIDLIIDPLTMKWCTFLGATGNNSNNYSFDLATDPQGNIYVTGLCDATYPTTPGTAQTAFGGPFAGLSRTDAFLSKFDRDGTTLLYSTYLGGSSYDFSHGVKVNVNGEAFICGETKSSNFPTSVGAYKRIYGGGSAIYGDAFVARFNANGSLNYSTLISGTGSYEEVAWDIFVNASNEAYVTGKTNDSTSFPTTAGCLQSVYGGGTGGDAFVTKLNATGTALLYSTYIGGSSGDEGCSIVLSATDEMFFSGNTFSNNFPATPGSYQSSYGGCTISGPQYGDAFAAKLNTAGTTLVYATYLGGTCMENAEALDINSAGEAFVTGKTCSNDFPITPGVFQTARTSGWEIFVTRLNASGSNAIYSTYIGGNNPDEAYDIAVTCDDEAYIAGYTSSTAYPIIAPAIQAANAGFQDHVVSLINSPGTALLASTYIGGANLDYFTPGIVLDQSNCNADTIVFNGTTHSPDYPSTPNRYQSTKINGGTPSDQPTLAKMVYRRDSIVVTAAGPLSICEGDSVQLSASGASGNVTYIWTPAIGINNSSINNPVARPTSTTRYFLTVQKACCAYQDSIDIVVNQIPIANAGNDTTICEGGSALLLASGGSAYSWNNGTNTATNNVSPILQTIYTVTVSNGNCVDDDGVTVFVNTSPVITAGANTTIIIGSSVQISASGGAGYLWSPSAGLSCTACNSPVATPTQTTTYYVIVSDANGCTAMDSVKITVDLTCGEVFVPNAFSPNKDGENDALYVMTNAGCVREFAFRIYDRWGEMVFESSDITKGWDGMLNNKECNSGVFAYQLTVLLIDNTSVTRSGNVTLLK